MSEPRLKMSPHLAVLALSTTVALAIFAQTNANPCGSGPCLSGGTCKATGTAPTDFVCHCRGARYGKQCSKHMCRPNPCKNKAQCKWFRNSATTVRRTCRCRKGYSGTLCEIDACVVSPCSASGKCKRMSKGERICQCKAGFLGDTCSVDACNPTPCQNGGKCRRRSRQRHMCDCKAGFTGISCDLDACDPNPCKYRGNCIPHRVYGKPKRHRCECKKGLSGYNCEIDNRVGSFKCQFGVAKMGSSALLLKDEEECDTLCYARESQEEQSVIYGCWYPSLYGGTRRKAEAGCGFFDDQLESASKKTDKQVMCFCKDDNCNVGTMDSLINSPSFPLLTELKM